MRTRSSGEQRGNHGESRRADEAGHQPFIQVSALPGLKGTQLPKLRSTAVSAVLAAAAVLCTPG